MRVIGLKAENVKKLKLVSVKFDPKKPVVTISGANEQGKSTFLDCFEYALSGAKSLKDVRMPIRGGEDHAKVVVETDELTVTRTWTAAGNTYLKVTNKEGWEPKGGAQALLDKLYSSFSFDPLAFSQMKDREQLDILLKLVKIPIDLTKWDADRKKIFDIRTEVNRKVTDLEGQLKLMTDVPADTPDEETSTATVLAEQTKVQAVLNGNNEKRRQLEESNRAKKQSAIDEKKTVRDDLDRADNSLSGILNDIDMVTDEIATLERHLAEKKERLSYLKKEAVSLEETKLNLIEVEARLPNPDALDLPTIESLGLVDPDMTVFSEKITKVEETNRLVRVKKKKAELETQLWANTATSEGYTEQLAAKDKEKSDALAAAKFPIECLSFNETGVLYKDIPFNQCSSAERLRVSTAMGMAMNPKFKAMFIRDASLLDSKNKAMIEKMAEENGFVIFLEIMDESGKLGIYIEDGLVKAVDGEPFTLTAEEVANV